eukprot:TRINITY_DN980_c0_g1_i3.p3 TRINITY_DN980_c0_g1~~TRINITY_DN980_c0_g1_i3.p3  ORF type:complete len:106 (+),score=15.13 TRINITY_DN980_c0_g1_i3:1088-1405(+)
MTNLKRLMVASHAWEYESSTDDEYQEFQEDCIEETEMSWITNLTNLETLSGLKHHIAWKYHKLLPNLKLVKGDAWDKYISFEIKSMTRNKLNYRFLENCKNSLLQ